MVRFPEALDEAGDAEPLEELLDELAPFLEGQVRLEVGEGGGRPRNWPKPPRGDR
jgi:hypothetical protein